MRRAFALLAALGLALTLAAPAAAKGKPEISPLDPTILDEAFLAGTCDFRAELVDASSNSKLMLFPMAEDGSQLLRTTGGYVSTLTNLDTGASIEIQYKSKIDFDVQPDGSQHIRSSGAVFVFVYDGDDHSAFEPGLYLVTGSMSGAYGPDGFALSPERVRGKVVDLCAALG